MQQIEKMQQEVKQLQHQIDLLSQANKAIKSSCLDLMHKAVCEQNLTEECQYIDRQEPCTIDGVTGFEAYG